MKAGVAMFAVLATNEPTLMLAPLPIRMPLGFTRNTWPFAVSEPCSDENCGPVTRLSTADCAPGCRKFTDSLAAMSNERQSMTARSDVCVMVVAVAVCEIVAAPPRTTPSVGPATAP
jgi:hypothetical protein